MKERQLEDEGKASALSLNLPSARVTGLVLIRMTLHQSHSSVTNFNAVSDRLRQPKHLTIGKFAVALGEYTSRPKQSAQAETAAELPETTRCWEYHQFECD